MHAHGSGAVNGGGLSGRARKLAAACLLVSLLAIAALSTVFGGSARAVSCTGSDEFTGAKSTAWANTENWSTGKLPEASTVVCFKAGVTPEISAGSQTAASIASGEALTLTGGSLKLTNAAGKSTLTGAVKLEAGTLELEGELSAGSLTISGGTLEGTGTLSVSGPVVWEAKAGEISGSVKVKQGAGSTFKIEGSSRFYFYGGTVESESPVTITAPEFIGADGAKLTTTSTITLAADSFTNNGGSGQVLSAGGFITSGNTTLPDFELKLTGNKSKLEGGTLTTAGLSTNAGTTMSISSGAGVNITGNSTINGTINGAGTFATSGGTVSSTGDIASAFFEQTGGGLTVESGAKLAVTTDTTLTQGTLNFDSTGESAGLTISGGTLEGTGTLSVSGPVVWEAKAGEISGSVKVKQGAGSTFKIEGSSRFYFYGGTVESESPVTITAPEFIGADGAKLTTTSTITLAADSFTNNGGSGQVLSAGGFITSGNTTLPDFELKLTGNKSKLEGGTLTTAGLSTNAGTTMSISSGAGVNITGNSTINGTINGAGTFATSGGTVSSTGDIASAFFEQTGGGLTVESGAKLAVTTDTTLTQGTLNFDSTGESAGLTISGGTLEGTGTLSVSGPVVWEAKAGEISGSVKIKQGAGSTFKIEGSSRFYFYGGTVESESPVTITAPEFIGADGAKLTTTSTITLAADSFTNNGGSGQVLSAGGFITSGNTTLPDFELKLTGNKSKLEGAVLTVPLLTIASGSLSLPHTLEGAVDVDGGELNLAGGKVVGTVTVAGGLAGGAGLVEGNLANTGGTVHPGLTSSGELEVKGSYEQGEHGTLEYKLAGPTAGTSFNQLHVTGSVHLKGAVSAGDESGFTPVAPATFLIISSPSAPTGGFETITGPSGSIYGARSEADGEILFVKSAPVNSVAPVLSGTPLAAQELKCAPGTWTGSGDTFTYAWYAGEEALSGQTAATLTLPSGHAGQLIHCTVIAKDAEGESGPASSNSLRVVAQPVNSAPPAISGTPAAGDTLTCSTGSWSEKEGAGSSVPAGTLSYSYSWSIEGTPVAGASAATFAVPSGTGAKQITCNVTASNAAGEASAASAPVTGLLPPVSTGAPELSGQAEVGQTLTCTAGSWSGAPVAYIYAWERDGQPIAGATGSTYTLVTADGGQQITCLVKGVNGAGAGSAAASAAVSVPAPTPLTLKCSGKKVEVLKVLPQGRSVVVSGVTLPSFAGQTIKITVSSPPGAPKGKGGSTTVTAAGTFALTLPAPKGPKAGKDKYTATVAGQSSLAFELGRELLVTGEHEVAGGVSVTLKGTGPLAHGHHIIAIDEQLTAGAACRQVIFARKPLGPKHTLTITLPAPAEAGAITYFRGLTPIAGKESYSLVIAVRQGA